MYKICETKQNHQFDQQSINFQAFNQTSLIFNSLILLLKHLIKIETCQNIYHNQTKENYQPHTQKMNIK